MISREIKSFAKSFIKIYKYKNYYLDNEKFNVLDITREINRTLELNDQDFFELDEFIRKEIVK
ncbi:hypothetical protein K413DRAFT_4717 [Clostridium sp. ASBs410]|nr:hypothetical protein K413DRAFT_4717 [Clostridium sp. ASBs410]